jgi:4-amino-4-deoxy-L-arabinose transferase-like glycosyltransferase
MEAAGLIRAPALARRGTLGRHALAAAALTAIVGAAAALRLWSFGAIAGNPFYDAAVRSMSLSWRNFFFGAFDPGAMTAVDKAPVDLWLQVASVRLLGFSSTALRVPELVGGVASVLLVYDLGRRLFGRGAGLAAAAALAVLPASVLTARSDTMDAVMMAFVVGSAWCVVRAAQSPRAPARWMLAAGAALGIAFNVKLAEALVPLPALALLAWLALGGGAGRRLRALTAGAAAFATVAGAWLLAVALAPGPKPFPIGSTDGTAWNVVLVFDGTARLGLSNATAGRAGGGPLALFAAHDAFGALIGSLLAAALLAGGLALVLAVGEAVRRRVRALAPPRGAAAGDGAGQPGRLPRASAPAQRDGGVSGEDDIAAASRLPRAGAPAQHDGGVSGEDDIAAASRPPRAGTAFVAVWLLTGIAVFSQMAVVYARYLDAMAPAVALALGAGAAWLARRAAHRRAAAAALVLAAGGAAALAVPIAHPRPVVLLIAAGAALALAALVLAARRRLPGGALLAVALVALLAVPAASALRLAASRVSDGGEPGAMPSAQLARLGAYLDAHRDGARYQFAVTAAGKAAALIAREGQPVLILTSAYGRPLVTPHRLAAAIRAGQVRYLLTGGSPCVAGQPHDRTGCAAVVRWAKAHARDVSRAAGVRRGLLLRLRP